VEPVVLADAAEACWRTAGTGAAALVMETDRTIRADESRLKQLFENLLRNAVEHGSTGSRPEADDAVEHGGGNAGAGATATVTVTVGELADGFYVADDGPGIPPDERETVLEAGYSTSADGTGFGLGIVTKVAGAHGWEIAVTESEGGGARIEVTGVEFVD
jgi:signal transduction histidine kinase